MGLFEDLGKALKPETDELINGLLLETIGEAKLEHITKKGKMPRLILMHKDDVDILAMYLKLRTGVKVNRASAMIYGIPIIETDKIDRGEWFLI